MLHSLAPGAGSPLRPSTSVPASYYAGYLRTCRPAETDDEAYSNFKSASDYLKVLEQPLEYFGRDCFELVVRNYRPVLNELPWQKLHANDELGNPTVFDRTDIIENQIQLDNYNFSSTTIRYIYYALEIISHDRKISPGKRYLKILEIGGGYGGQCWMLHVIAPIYGLIIESYSIVDLSDVCRLQERYLNTLGVDGFQCITTEEVEAHLSGKDYDLLVTNYSRVELPADLQEFYMDAVMPRASHGFLIWNLTPLNPRFSRSAFPLPKITREIPKSSPRITVTY